MHFFAYPARNAPKQLEPPAASSPSSPAAPEVDVISLGRRVRHLRKAAGLTLDDLSAAVGTAPSQLSLIENGKREPKLGLLQQLAAALGVSIDELLGAEPPNRRAALEIELERYQRSPLYESLNLPKIRISSRLPMDVLESMVGLQHELERRLNEQVATPEEARRANGELRAMMRERNNYFPGVRGRGAEGPRLGGAHQRPAVPSRHRGHRRAPRIQPPSRGRSAAFHPFRDRS